MILIALLVGLIKSLIYRNLNQLNWTFKNYKFILKSFFRASITAPTSKRIFSSLSKIIWQQPQQLLGYILAQLSILFWIEKRYITASGNTILKFRGKQKKLEKIKNGELNYYFKGFSLGNFIFFEGEAKSEKSREEILNVMTTHEFGHTLQSRIVGPLYFPLIAIPSLISVLTPYHRKMPWEKSADYLAEKYFKKHPSEKVSAVKPE